MNRRAFLRALGALSAAELMPKPTRARARTRIRKGTYLSSNYNPDLVRALDIDRVLITAPLHFWDGNYHGIEQLGIKFVAHFWDMAWGVRPIQDIQNLLNAPNRTEILMGNEDNGDPFGVEQVADNLIANMDVIMPLAPNARFILASGNQFTFSSGWFAQYIAEIQARRPDILDKFFAIGTHYYLFGERTLADTKEFLRSAYSAMVNAGLGDREMWLTEFGVSAKEYDMVTAADYVTDFFNFVDMKQANGKWTWLKFAAWFVGNHGDSWGGYHALMQDSGTALTRVGRRFRNA